MDLDKIQQLLQVVAESEVAEVSIEEEDFKITIRKKATEVTMQPSSFFPAPYPMPVQGGGYPVQGMAPQGPSAPASAPAGAAEPAETGEAKEAEQAEGPAVGAGEEIVRAPLVGTFYRRPAPDEDPFVDVGKAVESGQVLCIIEAMKIMNEIESEVSGRVKEVLAEDGESVEYDQPLFVIETA